MLTEVRVGESRVVDDRRRQTPVRLDPERMQSGPIGPKHSGRLILPLLSRTCDSEAWT
jgi:hypothetical protein